MLSDCPSVDVVVVGEGENTMCELADRGPSVDVPGLVLRGEDGPLRAPPRAPACDLDSLGPPAYDLFDMDYYTAQDRWLIRWLPLRAADVRTSRGCPNKCRFCAGYVASGIGVRFHSVEYVIAQLKYLVDTHGVEAIRFEDDTLGADPDRLREICAAIRAEGLHESIVWDGCLRVDQAEAGLLADMKSAGCIQVEYGFESGSDEMLRRLGKSASLEQNRRAVALTREAGLRIFADIMVGLPGETEADLRATIEFIRWANPEVLSAVRLCPLPGTPIYDNLPAETREAIDWAEYTYDDVADRINLTAIPDGRWKKVYRDFHKYFVRPKLTADLLRDTPGEWEETRRQLRRRLAHFAIRHPLRALRLPRGHRRPEWNAELKS
jgi:radical SAM superfamily enzyme YgiQ (UPF0313 family)